MEKWTYKKYRNPYLDIVSIQILENKIFIKSSVDNFDIEISNNKNKLSEIKSMLNNLRDPYHPSWKKVQEGENEIISNLLTIFDEQSLIINQDNVEETIKNQLKEIKYQIEETVELLAGKLSLSSISLNENLPILINEGVRQLKLLLEEMSDDTFFRFSSERTKENIDNFFISTILYQIKYLKRSHPLALLIWIVTLCQLSKLTHANVCVEMADSICLQWKNMALHWIGGAFNIKEIAIYQACLVSHLIDSTTENAKSLFKINNLEELFLEPSSGINFMVKVERLMNAVLENRGESSLFKKISSDLDANSPLVRGVFIEQYHVNRRFVEIIAPLLNKRLTDPLRERMFKYYEEEHGHEEFELKTCRSLGISEIDLVNAYPLPLMQAYVDAFTIIADHDPVGFFSSAMITEGMIGKPSLLYDYLGRIMADNQDYQQVARAHDNLNVDLNHAYLSRLFMGDIEMITPVSQQRAMRHVLYLLELNHRSLEQMTVYYSSQEKLKFYYGPEIGAI